MARTYKFFSKAASVFSIAALIFSILVSMTAHAADSVFTVQNVQVDVTAENSYIARDKAFEEAQKTALMKLAERLLTSAQLEQYTAPETEYISPMIKDFEVTNEQLSAVRYLGTYTFRFDSDAVRKHLSGGGYSYTDVSSKPVLVIPYLQSDAQVILWNGANPWLEAWKKKAAIRGLVPVSIPIGDLEDVSDLGNADPLKYDSEGLLRMSQRYGAGDVMILIATPQWSAQSSANAGVPPDNLTVLIYNATPMGPQFSRTLKLTANDVIGDETIYDSAIRQASKTFQDDWKDKTTASPAQNNMMKVKVRFENLEEWVITQAAIKKVQGINSVNLISLKPSEANLELYFNGTEDRLRLALQQADMSLIAPTSYSSNPYLTQANPYFSGASAASVASVPMYELQLNRYR